MGNMFRNVTLSTSYYSDMLKSWSKLDVQEGIQFNAGFSQYSSSARNERIILTDTFGWEITDGGEAALSDQPGFKFTLLISILSLIFGGIGITGYFVYKKIREKGSLRSPSRHEHPSINENTRTHSTPRNDYDFSDLKNHTDMNMYCIEKLNEQKSMLNAETYVTVRENLLKLLNSIKEQNELEFVDKRIVSDITSVLEHIAETYEDV